MEQMEKNISYTGITQATSDLNCADGELSLSHNIINQNGAMRPIILPDAEFSMGAGERLIYVHNTSNYKNFIYQTGSSIKAFSILGGARKDYAISYVLADGELLNKIESVGNTLVLLTTKGMYYLLFSELDYKYLGSEIPEIALSFGLTTRPSLYSDTESPHGQKYWAFTFNFDSILASEKFNEFTEGNKKQITDQVMASVNKYINNRATEKGEFIFPFFVRYALRLYDGTLTHHSSPILMIPSTKTGPMILCQPYGSGSYITSAKADIFSAPCRLDYQVTFEYGQITDKLKTWADIVKSVEVFISESIYTFDPNGKVDSFIDRKAFSNSLIGKLIRTTGATDAYQFYKYYQKWDYRDLLSVYANTSLDEEFPPCVLPLPKIDEKDFISKIKDCSNFYLLSSIPINNLNYERKELNVSGDIIKNLALRERMSDDYQSHDRLIPNSSFVYNNRLNIADLKRELFNGFSAYSSSCLNEALVKVSINSGKIVPVVDTNCYGFWCYVYVKEDGKNIIVKNSLVAGFLRTIPEYFFYPNPNAYKVVFQYDASNTLKELSLTGHSGLNGAYFFSGFNEINPPYVSEPKISEDRIVSVPNKLYTSEVGNPFFFPLEGINTIGVGKILGMASTTRALSQGQFGQFPLLVFATDGIWAMEVSNTGLYSVKQPISRDVCSNPESITQIDGAVVFVSEKGVMTIVGSEVNSISAELDGPSFDLGSVKELDTILNKEGLVGSIGNMLKAKEFFAGCRIAYDYPNARLVLFRPDKSYAYVYSLNSRTWATMSADFMLTVTDYPNAYIQRSSNGMINISKKMDFDAKNEVKTLMLSRPMKFADDEYKTVNQVINRGTMDRSKGAIVVFASVDGLTYFPIGSAIGNQVSGLQGSPYRCFRIGTVGSMSIKEALSMSSVYYTPKWRNRGR